MVNRLNPIGVDVAHVRLVSLGTKRDRILNEGMHVAVDVHVLELSDFGLLGHFAYACELLVNFLCTAIEPLGSVESYLERFDHFTIVGEIRLTQFTDDKE